MSTLLSDTVVFNSVSMMDYHTKSVTANGATCGIYSMNTSFAPLRTFNPNTTDAGTVARVLSTLIMDLCKPR